MNLEEIVTALNKLPDLVLRLEKLAILQASQAPVRQPEPTKSFYNIKEAAERLSVSTVTVRRLINNHELKRHLGMRHIRIPAESVAAYEKRHLSGGRR